MNNNNRGPQDDNILEAFLFNQIDKQKRDSEIEAQSREVDAKAQKEIIKGLGKLYTPITETQNLLANFGKLVANQQKQNDKSHSETIKLLHDNALNTKALYNLMEKRDGEAELRLQESEFKTQKDIVKGLGKLYTPITETQNILANFGKFTANQQKQNTKTQDESIELLRESTSNMKSLLKLMEKTFDNKKPQPGVAASKQTNGQPTTSTSEKKSKHEELILGPSADPSIPILQSINKNTSEILKLMKGGAKEDHSAKLSGVGIAGLLAGLVGPAVAAALAAASPEVGNGIKAGLGLIKAAGTAGTAIKAGVTAASGARAAAALASTKGPQKIGTLGKIGAGLGVGATIGRAMEGDTVGATLQGISTALPLLLSKTKYGKLASLAGAGIDVGLLGRDYIKHKQGEEEQLSAAAESGQVDPLITNTDKTNQLLQDIRDGKGGASTPGISAMGMGAGALALGAGALLMGRGAGIAKLATASPISSIGGKVAGGIKAPFTAAGNAADAAKTAASNAGKVAGKSALKMGGKLLPGIGLALGAYGAATKIGEGDYVGAAIEGASGIASLIPGIGTAVAIGLQGISATRDVIKATNEDTINDLSKTNEDVSKSLMEQSEQTNKGILDNNKTATDSMAKSASTLSGVGTSLDKVGTSLSTTLTNASGTLLGMIAKFSGIGLIAQAGGGLIDAAKNAFSGGAPTANSNASGTKNLHSSRKNNMVAVYEAFKKAGMNDNQAKIMTAEIGRENDFGNDLWGSHKDKENGLTNVGMMSWQNDRATKLMAHLKKGGHLNADGSIKRTKEALDAQAKFIVSEMRSKEYANIGRKFLDKKDISYQEGSELLGKEYIKWRYTDKNYANGHKRRDDYYADIKRASAEKALSNKKYISKKEFAKLSKAEARPSMVASPQIHKAWETREKNRKAELAKVQEGILNGTTAIGSAPVLDSDKKSTSKGGTKQTADEGATGSGSNISNQEYYNLGVKNTIISGADMKGLIPACREAFYTMIGELFATKKPKKQPRVTSAFRSHEKQKVLYAEALRKYGSEQKARKWVALPGNSKHEKGTALDVDYKQGETVSLLISTGLLKKYNFTKPLSNEPWHIEYGSGSVGAAAGAAASAVGDLASAPSFENATAAAEAAKTLVAEGLGAILSSDTMDSVRDFIKGGKVDAPSDKGGVNSKAVGSFTSTPNIDVADPKDNGNGVFWENLDQQLGGGELQRQERDQAKYDAVKKAWTVNKSGARQGGGGFLDQILSILLGEGSPLSLPGVDAMGVFNGGFGGALNQNQVVEYSSDGDLTKHKSDSPTVDGVNTMGEFNGGFNDGLHQGGNDSPISPLSLPGINSMGVFNGGFGGGLYQNQLQYDNTLNQIDDHDFEQAKMQRDAIERERQKVELSIPAPTSTPTQQAPSNGASGREGLTGSIFTRNPDSIIQQVAVAYIRSSL